MIQKLKTFLLTVAFAGALLAPMAVPAVAVAQTNDTLPGLCEGIELKVGARCETSDASKEKIDDVLSLIINIFSLVVGVVAVVMIIVGGLKYITSAGDSGNVTSAKNTIIYALVGLVIVALAQFLVRFVLNKVTEA